MTRSSTCSPPSVCEAGMIDFIAAEEDIEAILRAPFSVPISDATYPVEGLCHPRVYGSAARFLAHYFRERGILTLPQAVHKLTMQSADRLGLSRKGRIAVGADADLCLFSPENIRENGAYTAPRQLASGMDAVFVAGVPEIMDGQFTGETRGRVLRAH
ncbi:MAG: amidohydrolase family protein [Oscillospiraceae bacterium]